MAKVRMIEAVRAVENAPESRLKAVDVWDLIAPGGDEASRRCAQQALNNAVSSGRLLRSGRGEFAEIRLPNEPCLRECPEPEGVLISHEAFNLLRAQFDCLESALTTVKNEVLNKQESSSLAVAWPLARACTHADSIRQTMCGIDNQSTTENTPETSHE